MEWVVYELVASGRVLVRDYDTADYVRRLTSCPVVEEGSPGAEAVLEAYRAGLTVGLRVVSQGLTERLAERICEGLGTPWLTAVGYSEVAVG